MRILIKDPKIISKIYNINNVKYILQCHNHTGNSLCSNIINGAPCDLPNSEPCVIPLHISKHATLINKLDTNDKVWAIQNLQSNDIINKSIDQFIICNNSTLL